MVYLYGLLGKTHNDLYYSVHVPDLMNHYD